MDISYHTTVLQVQLLKIYKEFTLKALFFSLKSLLKKQVIFGKNSVYGTGEDITNSVIGDYVTIGKNTKILNSFIFPNCTIGDNCTISHSIIGPNCVLESNSRIGAGTVLGYGVHIVTDKLIEDTLVQATEPDFCMFFLSNVVNF